MSDESTMEDRIHQKMDVTIAGSTEVSQAFGGISFKDMSQVMEFAKLMSVSRQAVPKHLREQPGTCLAVTLQALNWRMDPFAVANKSYAVNDRVAYEAQLIQAVIEQRAPIKGRIKGGYEGEGEKRVCKLRVISAEDDDQIEYRSPEIGLIKVKSSPLWKADPDQQLWYYSARAMCRRHFPDVLLGVYEKEEIQHAPELKDVTPTPGGFAAKAQAARQVEEPKPEPEPEIPDAEEMPPEDDVVPLKETEEWQQGMRDHAAGRLRNDCPHEGLAGEAWLAAWDACEAAT